MTESSLRNYLETSAAAFVFNMISQLRAHKVNPNTIDLDEAKERCNTIIERMKTYKNTSEVGEYDVKKEIVKLISELTSLLIKLNRDIDR